MLPGLRLVTAAIAAAVLVIVLGIAALARLHAAQDRSASLPPPAARFAGLSFAERADWTPDLTTRRVSLESLPPFAKGPTTFDPPKIALAEPAPNKPPPDIVIAIDPAPLDLTPGPIPIIEPAAAPPPPPATAIEARADLPAIADEPLGPELTASAAMQAIPLPAATTALPPDIFKRAVEAPRSLAVAAIPLPADRPAFVRTVTKPIARRRMARHIRATHIKSRVTAVHRPPRMARKPAPPPRQQPPASAAPANPFAALFGLRPTGAN